MTRFSTSLTDCKTWPSKSCKGEGVRSMDESIVAVESLSDFTTYDRPKSYERQDGCSDNGGGDYRGSQHVSPRTDERVLSSEMGKLPYSKIFEKSSSRKEYEEP